MAKVPGSEKQKAGTDICSGLLRKDLAATYSRASYTSTTIGKTVFDGRVRDGIGSGHSFMTTKKLYKELSFSENYTQGDKELLQLN
jgi:hypothetical protein